MSGYLPPGFGQDVQDTQEAADRQLLDYYARLAGRRPAEAPQMEPSKNLGPLRGGFLDDVSAGVLQALQRMPQRRDFGGALAQGALGGFTAGRVNAANSRAERFRAAQETAQKRNEAAESFRASAANRLMEERAIASRTKQPVMSDDWIEVTPEIAAWAEKKNIAIPPGVRRVKLADLTRNMPVNAPGISLSPEAMSAWSEFVAMTGTLPSGVARSKDLTAKLLEGAVPFLKNTGGIAANKAGYQADRASLTKLQSLLDGAVAFESTALKNLSVLEGTLSKIPDTGSPILNTPLRAINRTALGAEDMAAYEAARTIIVPEFARLLQSATLAGQLTDEARSEVKKILAGNYTIPQMKRVFDVLRQDAENRKAGYQSQIDNIYSRIGGRTSTAKDTINTAPVKGNENGSSWVDRMRGTVKPVVRK